MGYCLNSFSASERSESEIRTFMKLIRELGFQDFCSLSNSDSLALQSEQDSGAM